MPPNPHILTRRGLTIIELVTVIAIIGILASIGVWTMQDLMSDWRTRSTTRTFASALQTCRTTAISTGAECRVLLGNLDATPADATNSGQYFLQVGDSAQNSTNWEFYPPDALDDGSDDDQSQGTYDLADPTNNAYNNTVSILSRDVDGTILGPGAGNANAIVFNARGYVTNPIADFSTGGYIAVTFVNTEAAAAGNPNNYRVFIAQSGMVRIDNTRNPRFAGLTAGLNDDL